MRGARRVRRPERHHRALPREVRRGRARASCPCSTPTGPGPARAIRFGIDHARAPVAVVTMADGSDDAEQIDDLCKLVERGVVVAAASRYASGGQQVGGPLVQELLSRMAGLSLYWFARVGTRDATNSFKAYSTEFVRLVGIESDTGFEIGHRARRQGPPAAAARRRDPDDLARARRGRVEVQGRQVAPALPALVPVRVRPAAHGRGVHTARTAARTARRRPTQGASSSPDRPGSSAATWSRSCSVAATRSSGIDNHSKYGRVDEVVRRPSRLHARRGRRARHRAA